MRMLLELLVLLASIGPYAAPALAARPPNIVFLFADDLGYGDLRCYGHPYARTPNIDRLATEGTRFTQFYVTGVTCCPSRTGFMTGKYPATFATYPANGGFGHRTTITELLKQAGYATGHFGKWHIGPETESGTYGIDTIKVAGGSAHNERGRDAVIYDDAIAFIKTNRDRPFYINVWGHATHFPVNTPNGLVAEFKDVNVDRKDFSPTMQHKFDECVQIGGDLDDSMRQYLGDVYQIDLNVGRVLRAIEELGLREKTIVVFSSDHGPAPVLFRKKGPRKYSNNMLGYAGEFRGGKHQQYEGGVRVPFILRWPGRISADRVDETSVVSGIDWLPTLCAIAGINIDSADFDGEDVSATWLGQEHRRSKPLFWKTSATGSPAAIRDGHWKLIYPLRGRGNVELYDLFTDPAETKNIASQHPGVAAQLSTKVTAWTATLPKTYSKIKDRED